MKRRLSLFLLISAIFNISVNTIAYGDVGSVIVKNFNEIANDNKKTEDTYESDGELSAEAEEIKSDIPFTVTINGVEKKCGSFLEAVNAANNNKAVITLNADYIIGAQDIPETEGIYGGSQRMPELKGENTDVTLISDGGPFTIKRDTDNYTDMNGNILDSFIAVTDGATLTIGSENNSEAVIFDGGFTYDEDEGNLSPLIKGQDMGDVFGPFIVLKGGNLNANKNVGFKFNYSVNHGINGNNAAGYNGVIHAVDGDISNIVIDGAYIAGNCGNGLIQAGEYSKVILKDADIYYNSTQNISGSNFRGAVTVDKCENLKFESFGEGDRVQIRSNRSYNAGNDGTPVQNRSDNDIQVNDALELDGKIGIGEISIDNTGRKITAKKTMESEDSITVVIYNYSLNAATNSSNDFNISVEVDEDTEVIEENECIFLVKIDDYYYKAVNDKIPEEAVNGIKTIVFNTINRDTVIYRENEYVDNRARFGLVIAGGFGGSYDLEGQQKKYESIGFDICVQDEKPGDDPENAVYLSTDRAYMQGVLWNGMKEEDIAGTPGADTANPITNAALGRCYNNILNGDVGNWYWNCAFFGAEITDIPGNTKLWIRKHYKGAGENEDYVSDWVSEFTPSVYMPD